MNFREFLDVADTLAQGLTEAEWRSAISRAYYAAFHVGRIYLQTLGFVVPRGEQAHGFVWLRLSNSGHVEVRRVGATLSDLRKQRNFADYDDERFLSNKLAGDVAELAAEIIEILDSALEEP